MITPELPSTNKGSIMRKRNICHDVTMWNHHPWSQMTIRTAVIICCTYLYGSDHKASFCLSETLYLPHALMYRTSILFEKFHWYVLLKYKNHTEAICECRLNCSKYVMNGNAWQLVCYSTFSNQYITSMYYPCKTFRQFFCSIFYTNILLFLVVFQ